MYTPRQSIAVSTKSCPYDGIPFLSALRPNSGGSCSFKKRRCGPIVASDLSGKGRYDTQCEKPGYGEERQM